ncbi:MBL fold metallo-hydrolase [Leptothoe kymatousa]|uniref:MBL fold metallo-hydrolase n=1 Tax=Leptothoe kymatousa TAU-MAC 1615 TaxID=2364775 RepID=A0ABS5XYM7_9CYAN|nr:MBL fold metallo-hydrolase [Leptothoe kymatousa]MBT9310734.1 MBL fold metallo-hydrolase [Leptothoe kymatousa TAU-MAC 1615]
MKRRQLLRNASAAFVGTLGLGIASNWQTYQAQTGALRITSLGHMCFQFSGSGTTIITNPFDARGCTENYARPSLGSADLVLVSSRLLDEGFIPEGASVANLLDEPGAYEVNGLNIQGVGMPHDREGGRRFGINTAWLWAQAGINVVHLGGAAAPIELEDKILIGRPDVLLVPVGGGPKAYTPAEAAATIESLQPKLVIPTQFRTSAASSSCELEAVEAFLNVMAGTPVDRVGNTLTLQGSSLPASGMRIKVLS